MKKIITLLCIIHFSYAGHTQKFSLKTGHSAPITELEFSPDGTLLASGSADNTIVLWDNASGKQFVIFSGHTGQVNDIAFHPTRKILASASDDGTVRVWEYPSGTLLTTHSFFGKEVKSVVFSTTGKTLACGSDFIYLVNTVDDTYEKIGEKARESYNAVNYSPNGKYLAYAGVRETKTYLINIFDDGKIEETYGGKVNDLNFSSDSKYLFAAGKRGNLSRYTIENPLPFSGYHIASNNIFKSFQAVADNDEYFAGANRDNLIYVYTKKNGKKKYLLDGHLDEIYTLTISPDGKFLASSGKDRFILLWNLEYGTFSKVLSGTGTRINTIAFNDEGNELFIGYGNGVFRLWNLAEDGGIITERAPTSFFYQGSNEWSYSITDCNDYFSDELFIKAELNATSEWAEEYPKTREDLIYWKPGGPVAEERKHPYTVHKNNKLNTRNTFTLTGNAIHNFQFASTHEVRRAPFNSFKFNSPPSEVLRFSVSSDSLANKKKLLKSKRGKLSIKGDVIHQAMSESGELMAVLFFNKNMDNQCQVLDAKTGETIFSFPIAPDINHTGFTPNGEYLYVSSEQEETITFWDLTTEQEKYTLEGSLPVRFNRASDLVAYTNKFRNLMMAETETGKEVFRTPSGHTAAISDIKFNTPRGFLATASYDGFIKFWDITTGRLKVSLAAFNDQDFIFISPDNYYYSSFGAINEVSFTIGDELYAFEQFDLKYNRPDKVMARMGYTPKETLDTYYQAYLKRLKKLGVTEAEITTSYHIPELEIDLGDQLRIETEDRELLIKYKASDTEVDLKSLNVWINDVPIYGERGLDISDKKARLYEDSMALTLSHGLNKIQLSVKNMDATESMKETFEIIYKGKKEKPTLYIVAVGVSNYQDQSKNLNYAAKDASDIVALYSQQREKYADIKIDSLYNERVTLENIKKAKEQLMQSDIDDEVIVFFAGHGVLDKDYDYYLATYGTEFDRPETGMPYDEFISLVDGIPARKKLVLMDACHSGEIDKESVKLAEQATIKKGKKKFRAAGVSIANANNTFEVMNSLFPDLRRGAGAHVISSASGTEYAQESDEWKNGIFTLSFLQGLRTAEADSNRDREVDIAEIQEYLRVRVSEVTEGKQKPTSRVANYANNYPIWKK